MPPPHQRGLLRRYDSLLVTVGLSTQAASSFVGAIDDGPDPEERTHDIWLRRPMWSGVVRGDAPKMPTAAEAMGGQVSALGPKTGGEPVSGPGGSPDNGPVLVNLSSGWGASRRQRAGGMERNVHGGSGAGERLQEPRPATASGLSDDSTTPNLSESGRRRGRNEVIEEDSAEAGRATKQQGLTVDSMEGVMETSVNRSDGSSTSKMKRGSILRKWLASGGTGSVASRTGGSANTSSSLRSRVRPKGSKAQESPRTSLKWGRNTTKTFVRDDDSSEAEDLTPLADDGNASSPDVGGSPGKGKRAKRSLTGASSRPAARFEVQVLHLCGDVDRGRGGNRQGRRRGGLGEYGPGGD